MQIEEKTGIEQTCENRCGRLLQSVSGESRSNQGVIVRPDRSIVIGHGIVARLAASDCAKPPTGERCLVCKRCHHTARMFLSRDTSKKTVSRVRSSHPASVLAPIQRKGVGGKFITPKSCLEPATQRFGLF